MQFEQRQTVAPQQVQTHNISAKLIMSIQILQYSSLELEQSIAQQAAENPAFEVDELPQCMQCGTPLREGRCPTCANAAPTHAHDADTDWADVYEHSPASNNEDDEFDPMARVGYSATLEETLLGILSTVLPKEDMQIAEALVGNLNSYGWMTASLERNRVRSRRARRTGRGRAHGVASAGTPGRWRARCPRVHADPIALVSRTGPPAAVG